MGQVAVDPVVVRGRGQLFAQLFLLLVQELLLALATKEGSGAGEFEVVLAGLGF